jgi:hypothetical protein
VADLANEIEKNFPSRIIDVNQDIPMHNGYKREVDINMGNLVIQVKDGSARGLIGQMKRTAATTGRIVVGYAPGLPGQAWEAAAREGVIIARTPDELISILREKL